jgi:hypothetical protein
LVLPGTGARCLRLAQACPSPPPGAVSDKYWPAGCILNSGAPPLQTRWMCGTGWRWRSASRAPSAASSTALKTSWRPSSQVAAAWAGAEASGAHAQLQPSLDPPCCCARPRRGMHRRGAQEPAQLQRGQRAGGENQRWAALWKGCPQRRIRGMPPPWLLGAAQLIAALRCLATFLSDPLPRACPPPPPPPCRRRPARQPRGEGHGAEARRGGQHQPRGGRQGGGVCAGRRHHQH